MPFDGTDFKDWSGGPQDRGGGSAWFFLREASFLASAFFASGEAAGFCCDVIDNFPPTIRLGEPSNNSVVGMGVAMITFALLMGAYVWLRADYIVANDLDLDTF